ncbi:MAG: hypothetical protein RMJ00_02150 [Nitrososphaerota archaeon]|nr:hypothetical protein [Candidatus Bathyarchaeota archaeon]MDW8061482.1 hypothetical protein [Nitrososphaerota archaeon]
MKQSNLKWIVYTFLILWITIYASTSTVLTLLSLLRPSFIQLLLPEIKDIPSILLSFVPIFATSSSISFLVAGFILDRKRKHACYYIAEALEKHNDTSN